MASQRLFSLPAEPNAQKRDQHHQRSGRKADRVGRHKGSEGSVLRKHPLNPANAHTAYAQHGQQRGSQRYAEAAQIAGKNLVQKAERMGQHHHCQADKAGFHHLRIAVKNCQQLSAEAQNQRNRRRQRQRSLRQASSSVLRQRFTLPAPQFCPTKVVQAWLKELRIS